MVYVVGPEWLTSKLSKVALTNKPEGAKCAVIKMPGNAKEIEAMPPETPVLVVVSGMMSLGDARATRRAGVRIVSDKDVAEEVEILLKASEGTPDDFADDDDDEIISLESVKTIPEKTVQKPEQPAKKTGLPTKDPVQATRKPEPPARKPEAPAKRQEPPVRKLGLQARRPEVAAHKPEQTEQKPVERPVVRFPVNSQRAERHPARTQADHLYIKSEPKERNEPEEGSIEKSRPAYRKDILTPRTMQGNIISSYSASGGEGKTFMATNLGALCASEGVSTCLIDLDLGFSDADVATGLVDEVDRTKVMDKKAIVPPNGWATVTDWRKYAVNLKSNILRHNSGLYVLPAFPYAGKELKEPEVEDLLQILAENFELVVVDLGVDGFSNQARVALRMSNAIMIVAGQDRKTIAKMLHFLQQEGGKNNKMQLVFNKRSATAFYDPKEVAKKVNFDKYYTVPLDEAGVNAAKLDRKLVVQLPGTPSGEAIRNFAAAVTPFKIPAGEVIMHRKAPGFISRLFAKLKRA